MGPPQVQDRAPPGGAFAIGKEDQFLVPRHMDGQRLDRAVR
jgi:hypothetical protein